MLVPIEHYSDFPYSVPIFAPNDSVRTMLITIEVIFPFLQERA